MRLLDRGALSVASFRRAICFSNSAASSAVSVARPANCAGRSSGTEVQVLKGLNEGDEVILYPGDRITDGQRVQPLKV